MIVIMRKIYICILLSGRPNIYNSKNYNIHNNYQGTYNIFVTIYTAIGLRAVKQIVLADLRRLPFCGMIMRMSARTASVVPRATPESDTTRHFQDLQRTWS